MAKNNGAASGAEKAAAQSQNAGAPETPEQKAAREAAEAEAKAKAEAEGEAVSVDTTSKIVSLRHKTTFPTYGRAGVRITRQAKDYRVTPEQLAVLKADPWVEVVEK